MRVRTRGVCITLPFCFWMAGCVSLAARHVRTSWLATQVRPTVYPGLAEGPRSFLKDGTALSWVVFVLDVPLSLTLDTLLLPYDLASGEHHDRVQASIRDGGVPPGSVGPTSRG